MKLVVPVKIPFLLFMVFFLAMTSAWAGQVVKVKGRKVYIKFTDEEADSISKGSRLYLTTSSGKKRGLVVVRKKKGNKAIALLKKGKAKKKMLTRLRKSKRKRRTPRPDEGAMDVARAEIEAEESHMSLGLLGSYGGASQSVKDIADMSGSMMGFKGVFDYAIAGGFGLKTQVGLDIFNVAGPGNGGLEYKTNISYLALDLFVRYQAMLSSFGFYGNLGMGIYSPMSTDLGEPEALEEDSISTTSLLILGGGVVIPWGQWQIQLGGDYIHFPPAEQVETRAWVGKFSLLFAL